MYTACSTNNQLVTLWNLTRKEVETLKKQSFMCPVCNFPVYIKNGLIKLPHFVHYQKTCCTADFQGETQEHLLLKKEIAKWCEREYIVYEMEKYLPQIKQRPDILVGDIAIEIQCSPLSIKQLIKRNNSYVANGYKPFWICGEKLIPRENEKIGELRKHFFYYSSTLGYYMWGAD